jgi:GDP-4-dehydro-6-deoxy-D-mannose reductase
MSGERGGTRVLVTGASGFVGPHLVDALRRIGGDDIEVIATSKDAETHRRLGPLAAFDVCDAAAVGEGISHWRPTHVVNLAGLAAPANAAADSDAA